MKVPRLDLERVLGRLNNDFPEGRSRLWAQQQAIDAKVSNLRAKLRDMGDRAPHVKLEPREDHYYQHPWGRGSLKDSYYTEREAKQAEADKAWSEAIKATAKALEEANQALREIKSRRKYQPKEAYAVISLEGNRAIFKPLWASTIEECSIEAKPTGNFEPRDFNVANTLARLRDLTEVNVDVEIKDKAPDPTTKKESDSGVPNEHS